MVINSQNIIEDIKKGIINLNDAKIRAAYALNLCTVSVSQIIDYDDVVILEQEYEAILNNLNIEKMPKDEALLNILKQLLDTITYFRIQEGDKKFIDLDYQNKMKNAIWDAIPGLGLLVAGGNPVTMAFSLASQVGIGYMNYRKSKAVNSLAYEKEQWQLHRAAIEQFNGLRRELFDTAWRLVDAHAIPDKYRLTERQVTQYNNILMDSDYCRRFERLDSIQNNFIAYPPFWYFFGNTANMLSSSTDADEAAYYKIRAKMYYEISIRLFKNCDLQRENPLASACALEYIDLLDPKTEHDRNKISDLIDYALEMSGNANDVLQLCAFAYIKNRDNDKAARIFRCLINEDYNVVVNSQLLSSYYVSAYISGDNSALVNYKYLSDRIDEQYLFPMPDRKLLPASIESLNTSIKGRFIFNQKEILAKKYEIVIDEFRTKYRVQFNRCIPIPGGKDYTDAYFMNSPECLEARRSDGFILKKRPEIDGYVYTLKDCNYPYNYLSVLNNMCHAITILDCIQGHSNEMVSCVSDAVIANHEKLQLFRDAVEEPFKFSTATYNAMLDVNFDDYTGCFFEKLSEYSNQYILLRNDIITMNVAESNLREFCIAQGLDSPEELYESANNLDNSEEIERQYLSPDLIDDGKVAIVNDEKFNNVKDLISRYSSILNLNNENCHLLLSGKEEFDYYFVNLSQDKRILRRKTIAIIDDLTNADNDLLFTTDGIVQIIRGKIKTEKPYDEIMITPSYDGIYIHQLYTNSNLNMREIINLIQSLSSTKSLEIKNKTSPFDKITKKVTKAEI